ncbi:biotin/lipoyl-containing protein, partial [Sphingomonas sp. ZT3P38]|uniref:biotin/lipoyl-containing protein n=1 Tax=Parasphingomonas zepuensis TaxID=3096161 RepID=UPI003FA7B715
EGIAEAEIVAWHVKVGERVEEDMAVADMMTDKATVEMESPVSGVVVELAGEVGDQVPIGAALMVVEVDVEAATQAEVETGAETEADVAAEAAPAMEAEADVAPLAEAAPVVEPEALPVAETETAPVSEAVEEQIEAENPGVEEANIRPGTGRGTAAKRGVEGEHGKRVRRG